MSDSLHKEVTENSSPTPRLDAVLVRCDEMTKGGDPATPATLWVLVEHAGTLERELAEEKAEHRATLNHAASEREQHALALSESQNRWRPASEEPPRDPEAGWAKTVLLFFPENEHNLGYYDPDDGWMAYDGGGHYERPVDDPTHWMPLPEAPK